MKLVCQRQFLRELVVRPVSVTRFKRAPVDGALRSWEAFFKACSGRALLDSRLLPSSIDEATVVAVERSAAPRNERLFVRGFEVIFGHQDRVNENGATASACRRFIRGDLFDAAFMIEPPFEFVLLDPCRSSRWIAGKCDASSKRLVGNSTAPWR